ncbi:MAG: sulfatase [Akkermansiaceae bacterium]
MNNTKLVVLITLLIPGLSLGERKPNIIVIMCDDLGYSDVGFNGCKDIPTPQIDSIASNGVRCTSGYTSYSVCGPSRAGFITGRYQQRFGFERNPQYDTSDPNMGVSKKEATIANALSSAGYHCGVIGKWHLGAHKSLHPLNRGFDEFYGHLGGGHQYFPEMLTIKDSYSAKTEAESYRTWILRNHEPIKTTKYLTDEFSDEAVRFVQRNKEKPFFLFLSYNAPHGPLQATQEYLDRFPNIKNKKRKTYAAMVSAVDDGVGRLLKSLHENQLTDNTLIFFLSDNGGPSDKNGSNNSPLRGKKSDVWEGGFRVPFAVQWPAKLPRGRVYSHPVSALDIFATAADVSKAKISPDRPLDGVNLMPYLAGEIKNPPHAAIYLRKFDQQRFAVRKGDFKLVILGKDQPAQLFNLSKDIAETKNIAAQNPDKLAEIDKLRNIWASELIDPVFKGLIHRKGKKGQGSKKLKTK